jgi:phospholipid/cholesterol/gamma-HCH transport system substrate-binding protein
MNESPNRRAVIVGLFVIVGILFFVAGIFMVGDLHDTFKTKMELVSLFDDVNGLKKGNNIWFSGVKIGIVSDMQFQGKSKVKVTMSIETKSQQYIRKDATVKISSDGFIGNKILIISGGTEASGQVKESDTLKVENTVSTEDMINTLQENNKNFLAITTNFKTISNNLVAGEGTIGKLLKENTIYDNINQVTLSLQKASGKAQELITSLATFSNGLNKKGTLANELSTDTVVFTSVKTTVMHLQQIADTASIFINNLKQASSNPKSPIGILLHDKESGTRLQETIKNLESSSKKLDKDLEAAQHSFLLKKFFKKEAKNNEKKSADSLINAN